VKNTQEEEIRATGRLLPSCLSLSFLREGRRA